MTIGMIPTDAQRNPKFNRPIEVTSPGIVADTPVIARYAKIPDGIINPRARNIPQEIALQ